MPAVPPQELIQAILDALQESGGSGILTSSPRTHPRKFVVQGSSGESVLWVYAWSLTHGGRPTLPNEYRIQMTTVSSPLELNPDGLTALIGYEPNLKVFAGFDLSRHRTFTSGSPSVQVDIKALRSALQDGLAFDRKDNGEVAVGFRPDQFLSYIHTAATLHKFGRSLKTFGLLKKISEAKPIPPLDLSSLTKERQRVVQTVKKMVRASNFRQQIMGAYGNRCAVSRMQLRLVEAAHILPVGAPGSVDHVSNGIALSPTYHRAYDNGLIFLTGDYVMRVNPDKEKHLINMVLDGGLPAFRETLGKIHLPPDKHQWPDPRLIKKANEFRMVG